MEDFPELEKVEIYGYHAMRCDEDHWHVIIHAVSSCGEAVEFSNQVASSDEAIRQINEINLIEEHL